MNHSSKGVKGGNIDLIGFPTPEPAVFLKLCFRLLHTDALEGDAREDFSPLLFSLNEIEDVPFYFFKVGSPAELIIGLR